MKCKLCGEEINSKPDSRLILNKYSANYYLCPKCGLYFIDAPTWLDEAYNDVITFKDTGIMMRNKINEIKVSNIIDQEGVMLDYGGGFGIFARMMRDKGYDFRWFDKFAEPLIIKGFEYRDEKIDWITCFECLEHLDDVCGDIDKIFKISHNVIFSTELYDASSIHNNDSWNYLCLETGQHIAFYSEETMKYLARKYNTNYYNISGLHVFSENKMSIYERAIKKIKIKLLLKLNKFSYKYCEIDNKNLAKIR